MKKTKYDHFQIYEMSHKNPTALLFFAHANGIPALVYTELFSKVIQKYPVKIVSYDTRAIGLSSKQAQYDTKSWGWRILVHDHIEILNHVKKQNPDLKKIYGMGHSLGAWLTLLSAPKINYEKIILLDPPVLHPKIAFSWFFLSLIKLRKLNPQSKKVLRRKKKFPSKLDAFNNFKKSGLMKNWDDTDIYNYIEAMFDENKSGLTLRHQPEWEAHLFEQYPPTAAHGFLSLKKSFRNKLNISFIVGANSDTCNPNAHSWVLRFFPKAKWTILEKSGHMFPIEQKVKTVQALSPLLKDI